MTVRVTGWLLLLIAVFGCGAAEWVFDDGKIPGKSGPGLRIGRDSERNQAEFLACRDGIPDFRQGTISFWVQPLDWSGDDAKFHMFAAATAGDEVMFVYKYIGSDQLYFLYGPLTDPTIAAVSVRDWHAGEWHHIGAVYTSERIKLYIDGLPATETAVKAPVTRPFEAFYLGPYWNHAAEAGYSVLDEVKVADTPWVDPEMEREYRCNAGTEAPRHAPVVFRVGTAAPRIDGVHEAGEYALEASGFFDLHTRQYAATQARYGLAADADKLYLLVESPVPTPLKHIVAARDGSVWEDDAVEVHLAADSGDVYQWVVNADGVAYDAKNGDPVWNADDVVLNSRVADGVWTLEMAVPWRTVGGAQPWWHFNLARSYVGISEFTSVAPSRVRYADVSTMAVLCPDPRAPRVRLTGPGELGDRKLDLQLEAESVPAGSYSFRVHTDNRVLPFAFEETRAATPEGSLHFAAATSADRPLPESAALTIAFAAADGTPIYRTQLPYQEAVPFKIAYWYMDRNALHVVVRPQPFSKGGSLEVALAASSGAAREKRRFEVPASSGDATLDFDLTPFAEGDYRLELTGRDFRDAVFLDTWELITRYPDVTPWHDFTGGIACDAPAPWTPLAWSGDTLTLWNRRYRFGADLLPVQLTSSGKELLASSVRWVRDGKPTQFQPSRPVASVPGGGDGVMRFEAAGALGDLGVKVRLEAAFDGLLVYDLELAPLQPDRPVHLTGLALEFPLARRYATGFDDNRSLLNKTDLSSLPPGTGLAEDLNQAPILWAGDSETGVMFGCENLRGWHCRDEARSAVLALDENAAVLRLQLADEAFELREPRRIRFLVQATPVRPVNPLAKRQYDVSGSFGAGSPLREVSPDGLMMWSGYWQQFYGLPDPRFLDAAALEEFARNKQEAHVRIAHYFGGYSTSPYSPAWTAFGRQWHAPPPKFGETATDAVIADRAARNANVVVAGCFNDPDYRNFQLWNFSRVLDDARANPEDLYFDYAWPKSCANPLHGCAYTDDFGRPRMTTGILGTRDYYERIYRMLHEKHPDGMIAAHVISMKSPSYSFFDFLICGEAYDTLIVRDDNYYDVFTPELLRIAYTPSTTDHCVWMLPQFVRAHLLFAPEKSATWSPDAPESIRAIRHMIGYLVVHNVDFWPSWGAQKQAWEILKAQFELDGGTGMRTFYPYWQPGGPVLRVTPHMERVMVSAYGYEGRYLLALLNDTDELRQVEVTLAPAVAATAATPVFAPDTPLSVVDHTVTVPLQPREFQLLRLP